LGFTPYEKPRAVATLETPCALINLSVLNENIGAAARAAAAHSVTLRPHAKTHKSAWIASSQIDRGAAGVTVAKVSEAEALVGAGIPDVFVAYPLVTDRQLDRLLDLRSAARVAMLIEDLDGAERASRAVRKKGGALAVWVDVDTGLGRIGAELDDGLARLVDRTRNLPGFEFQGLSTHEGHVYKVSGAEVRRSRVIEWVGALVEVATELGVARVSTGATPSYFDVVSLDGVTDARPGNYVFYDAMQVGLGSARIEDCAFSVLTTCISRRSGRSFIDAGSKAFSSDVGAHGSQLVSGYGIIKNRNGILLTGLSEEHGWLAVEEGVGGGLAVGDQLEVIPNHSCSTIANFDFADLVLDGMSLGRIEMTARGCLT
jgi:D-serine deaminase-like pyridoxal phosphate-dependent protein